MSKNYYLKQIFFFSLLCYNSYTVSAQDTLSNVISEAAPQHIEGIVIDAMSQETLPGAVLRNIPNTVHAVSDAEGKFSLTLPTNEEKLIISYLGYVTDTVTVDQTSSLSIALNPDAHTTKTLEDVEVRSRRKTTEINLTGAMKVEKIGSGELLKAACCNLSESFETSPSVDVGFTDAVSGYKQIQMLGLAGAYTSFTRENVPDIRGLAAISGLTFTPGTFVESMQLSKGTGSVVNGFEGVAGQINVEWIKPFEEETPTWLLNAYQSAQGRTEGNVIYNKKINEHLSTNILLHGRNDWLKTDNNKDGFLDNPLGTTFIGSNRWMYFGHNGFEIQAGFKYVYLDNVGGQTQFSKKTELAANNPWGYTNKVNRLETWAKLGKVYPEKPYKSMGLQLVATFHNQENSYGLRQYEGKQRSFYGNYIYQTIISNTNHVIKGGASFMFDDYKEHFQNSDFLRKEIIPGAFAEYSYNYLTHFNIVAGLRADYHNIFGAFLTPRLHIRYAPADNIAIRMAVGRAQRTANVFAENMGYMASSRAFKMNGEDITHSSDTYPFKPEVAWNMGLSYTQKFMLNYRDGAISVDYFYTNFQNQVVTDIEAYNSINFYNLVGRSYAHSFQAQLDYELIRNFDLRLAYRFYNVKTQYDSVLLQKPLVAAHRAFLNLAYKTKNNWKFDFTTQWTGAKRLPAHYNDHAQHIHSSDYSKSFWLMNAQINKSFYEDKLEVYVGAENLSNFMQHPLISDAQNPFGANFDASLIWGPAMGRNIYAGFRLKL